MLSAGLKLVSSGIFLKSSPNVTWSSDMTSGLSIPSICVHGWAKITNAMPFVAKKSHEHCVFGIKLHHNSKETSLPINLKLQPKFYKVEIPRIFQCKQLVGSHSLQKYSNIIQVGIRCITKVKIGKNVLLLVCWLWNRTGAGRLDMISQW